MWRQPIVFIMIYSEKHAPSDRALRMDTRSDDADRQKDDAEMKEGD
jgi:hypothetical protein